MREAYVVDTSVAVRWWVHQVGWEHAREVRDALVAGTVALATPDFTRVELTEVMRKQRLKVAALRDLDLRTVASSLDALGVDLLVLPVETIERAASVASSRSLRMFDAVPAIAALDKGWPLLTADVKSARALTGAVEVEVLRGIT